MTSPDVVVVGGGAIGASAAYALAARGARVTVLERSHVAVGCSYGNAGLISPSHTEALANPAALLHGLAWMTRRDSPFHVRPRPALLPWLARFGAASLPGRSVAATRALRALCEVSLELHQRLADSGLPTSFTRRGILSVYRSEAAFARARARLDADAAGDRRVLSGAAARDLEPALAPTIAGAIHHRREAHCDPAAFVTALLESAQEHGAQVRSGTEILRLRRSNGRITELQTTAGPLHAGAVVLAAGVWTRDLARDVGVHVPLEGGKGYHVELDGQTSPLTVPFFHEDAHVTATPLGGRVRLTGSLDLSGRDLRVDPVRVAALGRAAGQTLRLAAGAQPVHVWRGLRPCAPDGLPVVGAADGLANLFLATGHAMLGIALAPVTGQIVADLVCGERPRHAIESFSPARFRGLRDVLRTRTRGGAG